MSITPEFIYAYSLSLVAHFDLFLYVDL